MSPHARALAAPLASEPNAGRRARPVRRSAVLVAGLLGSGAAVTAVATTGRGDQLGRWTRRGTRVVAGALLLRGVAGFATSAVDLTGATGLYRRWDLTLCSPLCVALGTAAAIASGRTPR